MDDLDYAKLELFKYHAIKTDFVQWKIIYKKNHGQFRSIVNGIMERQALILVDELNKERS